MLEILLFTKRKSLATGVWILAREPHLSRLRDCFKSVLPLCKFQFQEEMSVRFHFPTMFYTCARLDAHPYHHIPRRFYHPPQEAKLRGGHEKQRSTAGGSLVHRVDSTCITDFFEPTGGARLFVGARSSSWARDIKRKRAIARPAVGQ